MEQVMQQCVIMTGISMMLLLFALSLDSLHMVNDTSFKVFARQSLFLSGAIPISNGVFGDDLESAVLYSVNCSGNETELLHCSFSESGVCSAHSAGVICQG